MIGGARHAVAGNRLKKIDFKTFALSFLLLQAEIFLSHISGEAGPTFGHANSNFSVFIDRESNQSIYKEMNDDNGQLLRYCLACFPDCVWGKETWRKRGKTLVENNVSATMFPSLPGALLTKQQK